MMVSVGEMDRRKRRIVGVTWVIWAIVRVCRDLEVELVHTDTRRVDAECRGEGPYRVARLMGRPFDMTLFACGRHADKERRRWNRLDAKRKMRANRSRLQARLNGLFTDTWERVDGAISGLARSVCSAREPRPSPLEAGADSADSIPHSGFGREAPDLVVKPDEDCAKNKVCGGKITPKSFQKAAIT